MIPKGPFKRGIAAGLLFLAGLWWFGLPRPLFGPPYSTVLETPEGVLLGGKIAADGQWRFPPSDSLPDKYIAALLTYEDKRFYRHPGVDIRAVGRAIADNLRAGRIVSGGSTLSMQVIRMARGNRRRTLWQKMIEAALALRMELTHPKAEILRYYAGHAPFGGNTVGLEAACWRYFGKSPRLLSWSEAALLAVLPNSPSLIHPGRNRSQLFEKRNRLLEKLAGLGHIDPVTLELALEETLPEAPLPLPRLAPHLLEAAHATHGAPARILTSIDPALQHHLNEVLEQHHRHLSHQQIHNIAALIIEVRSGNILAYAGNAPGAGALHHEEVDVITARRSTGSILKPLLYALALDEGRLLPQSLLTDVPSDFNGYRPENYARTYGGVVPADQALARSLNVPFVHLLRDYGLEKFHFQLREMGISTLDRPPGHYGLTLILGGAEASLLEISGIYASMARTLQTYAGHSSRYDLRDWRMPGYLATGRVQDASYSEAAPVLDAGAIWFALDAMQRLERPDQEGNWELFSSSRKIAWKTGTSFGFRDAWAVGVSPEYVVGVWVGNADGEGRPDLIGVRAAAPVMFDLFAALPPTSWFEAPYDDLLRLPVCSQSGYRPGPYCPTDTVWAPQAGTNAPTCSFHRLLHLDPSEQFQVTANCIAPTAIRHRSWLILSPIQEYYYQRRHIEYRTPPPFMEGCRPAGMGAEAEIMELIYPRAATRITIPLDRDGKQSPAIFRVAHREEDAEIHWHLDQHYLGSTRDFHTMEINAEAGSHRLILVDQHGNRLEQPFEIVENKKGS